MSTVVHQVFKSCEAHTVDPYWRQVLGQCALNKFPKGVRYTVTKMSPKDNTPLEHSFSIKVTFKGKQKVEVVSLPSKPEEMLDALLSVFKNKLGMFSTLDLKMKNDEMEEILGNYSRNNDCTWKQLKPKAAKDEKLREYVIGVGDTYNLTPSQIKHLLAEISLGFQLKILTQEGVDYSDGKIQSIEGVDIKKDGSLKSAVFLGKCSLPKQSRKEGTKKATKIEQQTDKFSRFHIARYAGISGML